MKSTTKYLVLFFILAFAISWILWIPSVLNSNGYDIADIFLLISQFAIFGPLIAALIVLGFTEGKCGIKVFFKNAWNWKFNKLWLIVIIVLPFAFTSLSYVIKSLIEHQPIMLPKLPMPIAVFAVFQLFVGGPIEEFGWRGYALPRLLKRMPMLPSSLILGFLHGLWHLPLVYMIGTVQSAIPFWEFVAVTAVGSVIYTWIYQKTNNSLVSAILFHWFSNMACSFMYYDTRLGRFIFFGIQLLLVLIILFVKSKKIRRKKYKLTNFLILFTDFAQITAEKRL